MYLEGAYKERNKDYQMEGKKLNKEMKTFFIVSIQRSGSNWLQRCLDYHPQIMVRGEVHPSRFLALVDKMHTGDDISEAVMKEGGIFLEIGRKGVQCMVRANLEANGCNFDYYDGYLADKTAFVCHDSLKSKPEQLQYIKLLCKYFPEAKKILLVRDVRDIIVSVASWKGKAENLRLLSPNPKGYAKYIRYLYNWVTLHERWLTELNDDPNSLIISFEEMKRNFKQVMTQVHDFLEFSIEPYYLEELYSNFYNIKSKLYEEENRKRGYSFFRSGEVGEWRSRFKWYHFPILWLFNQRIHNILKQI